MNERGKELIENFRWESRLPSSERRITYGITPEELEKFAELIIQECIRLGEESQYKCRTFPVSVAIKDHFGIN